MKSAFLVLPFCALLVILHPSVGRCTEAGPTPLGVSDVPLHNELLDLLERTLRQYLENDPTACGWIINRNEGRGIIETNWYTVHKGEIWLKAEIALRGRLYRVDVWGTGGLILPRTQKTDRSQRVEWALQEAIDKAVVMRKAPADVPRGVNGGPE